MKQDRVYLTAGFLPAVVMILLMVLEQTVRSGLIPKNVWVIAAAEVVVFLIPILVLRLLRSGEGKRAELRFRPHKRQTVWFVLWTSLMTTMLALLIAGASAMMSGEIAPGNGPGVTGFWQSLLLVVVLPAVMEELFFRGAMLSAMESAGTLPAILLPAVGFAMIHGDSQNFLAPLIAGMIYGYMTYVLDSVWPAIFAHLLHNAAMLTLSHAAQAYSALGIWPYILLMIGFLFCLFLALSMRTLEKQIEKDRIRRLQRKNFPEMLSGIFISPGMWLLAILFLIRVLYE